MKLLQATGGHGAREEAEPKKLKLYSYWLSSCSCRVRIGLDLKGLEYEYVAVNFPEAEQQTPEFLKLNPMGYVPVLVDGDIVLADSFAILLYLDEKFPQHPLLPKDSVRRAINFQAANVISSSIQPRQLMLQHMREKLGPQEAIACAQDDLRTGFAALEKLLKDYSGRYATGNEVFLDEFPLLSRLFEAYMELPAFQDNMPGKQPDTPAEHRV
ncbi:glutathione S-transferase 2 isoform X4 [Coffea arabica]|uniref:Glutathione S-transferase 2 isoform X4 n=1 Tax=Coffea arabica TaxID=13443 RepID=A0ABM4WL60_COFAR